MSDRDELRDRLDALETRFTPTDTSTVVVLGREPDEPFPSGIDREDILNQWTEPGVDDEPLIVAETLIPIHRPPEYRGGVVVMSEQEVAQVFDSMPEEIQEQERQARIEHGKPVPPMLQP